MAVSVLKGLTIWPSVNLGCRPQAEKARPPSHSLITFHLCLQTGQISFLQKFAKNVKKQPTHFTILTFFNHFPWRNRLGDMWSAQGCHRQQFTKNSTICIRRRVTNFPDCTVSIPAVQLSTPAQEKKKPRSHTVRGFYNSVLSQFQFHIRKDLNFSYSNIRNWTW